MSAAEMLLLLGFILPGCYCHHSGLLELSVMLHSEAVLPCPHAAGNVTWSKLKLNGEPQVLISIINNQETSYDGRYHSQDKNALVIRNVETSDERLYLCNGRNTVYLRVNSDLPQTPTVPAGSGWSVGFEQDQEEATAEIQTTSDWWKIPVGAIAGASLMLLSIFTLKLCSAKRAERSKRVNETLTEVVYEEIRDDSVPPETPYYSTISGAANTFTAAEPNLYSCVRKLQTEPSNHSHDVSPHNAVSHHADVSHWNIISPHAAYSHQDTVSPHAAIYHLAQHPLQTENNVLICP